MNVKMLMDTIEWLNGSMSGHNNCVYMYACHAKTKKSGMGLVRLDVLHKGVMVSRGQRTAFGQFHFETMIGQ